MPRHRQSRAGHQALRRVSLPSHPTLPLGPSTYLLCLFDLKGQSYSPLSPSTPSTPGTCSLIQGWPDQRHGEARRHRQGPGNRLPPRGGQQGPGRYVGERGWSGLFIHWQLTCPALSRPAPPCKPFLSPSPSRPLDSHPAHLHSSLPMVPSPQESPSLSSLPLLSLSPPSPLPLSPRLCPRLRSFTTTPLRRHILVTFLSSAASSRPYIAAREMWKNGLSYCIEYAKSSRAKCRGGRCARRVSRTLSSTLLGSTLHAREYPSGPLPRRMCLLPPPFRGGGCSTGSLHGLPSHKVCMSWSAFSNVPPPLAPAWASYPQAQDVSTLAPRLARTCLGLARSA